MLVLWEGETKMIYKFIVKIDKSLGTIYYKPVLNVQGSFDPETDLEEFINQISKDIKNKVGESLK